MGGRVKVLFHHYLYHLRQQWNGGCHENIFAQGLKNYLRFGLTVLK